LEGVAQSFQLEALLNVLERQGVIRKAKVLEEITRFREKPVKAREVPHEGRGSPRRVCGSDRLS